MKTVLIKIKELFTQSTVNQQGILVALVMAVFLLGVWAGLA